MSDRASSEPEKHNLSLDDAVALVEQAFAATGLKQADAHSVANALVMAEAEGQVGHGFSRINDYLAQATSGKVNFSAKVSSSKKGEAYAIVDADHGFAFPAMDVALDQLTEMANQSGCAAVSVIRSHHCGALSIQVEKLAEAGLLALMVANTPAAIAPWGAKEPLYGTNPIAFAAPRADGPPLVIDLSLSKVARGKVMSAHKLGKDIPEGWALDQDGKPTTSPKDALAGSMLPIGEAKGTTLVLIVEILAAVLGGAQLSKDVSSFFTPDGPPPSSGQFILAIKPDALDGFTARLEVLLSAIANAEGARLPGARRLTARDAARKAGIDVPQLYIDQIDQFLNSKA